MRGGAAAVALLAALGNMLQGWDNATIAGSLLYIKREFRLEGHPALEGLVVATSLIGATVVTTFSGPLSDSVGRRPMLVASSLLYALAGLLMLWSPNVQLLLLSRLVGGLAVGLAVTLVPVYISETAPAETRGRLNTIPQLTGSAGMFLGYCFVFAVTLSSSPDWRLMLGVVFLPALLYVGVAVWFLPESPRWLVSKGRMKEAREVLRMLRGRDDVDGELALLTEGLGAVGGGGDTVVEEYVVGPAAAAAHKDGAGVTLYGPERGMSWAAQPVPLGSAMSGMSRQGSLLGSVMGLSRMGSMLGSMTDPVVALLGGLHDNNNNNNKDPSDGGTLFTNFGSLLGAGEDWDEENNQDAALSDDDELANGGLRAPLLDMRRRQSSLTGGEMKGTSTMGIGGGWQLAWKWTEGDETTGERGQVQRMYLHEEPSSAGAGEEAVHAAALVSRSALYATDDLSTGPALLHPAAADQKPRWREVLGEPGVRRALACGVALQVLQQFSGISGVLYYTPQILSQSGASALLASLLGLTADATAVLVSGLTTLLMLPAIGVAMRLMDSSGRRTLLLYTIPFLVASLAALAAADALLAPAVPAVAAAVSAGGVAVYLCCFVMGFGPVPNILCAEIFPTRARGVCIAVCSLAFWLSDIAVTYSLPVMLGSLGLAGLFSVYAAVCCVAFVFVLLRVPETKGLPLEVIADFFTVGANDRLTTRVLE